ncbi:MAG TPA: phage holin family protein [Nevskiaceae bacterium]|nr:phage holin family protein [Nevskiaceae bacterium]
MPADDADPRLATAPSPKLSDTLNELATGLLQFVEDRVDLLRWEAAHEGARIGALLVRGFCAALLGFFTLEVLAVLLIAVFWDTAWRLQVISGVVLAAFIGTGLLIVSYQRKRNERSSLLHPTVANASKS